MKDSKVQSAISHWAPRFVSNGVLLADFEEVTASLDYCCAVRGVDCEIGKRCKRFIWESPI